MSCEGVRYLEGGESVRRYIKGGHLDVVKEVKETLVLQYDTSEVLVANAFSQHLAAPERNVLVLISSEQIANIYRDHSEEIKAAIGQSDTVK